MCVIKVRNFARKPRMRASRSARVCARETRWWF